MEIINSETRPRKIEFKGTGSDYFVVLVVNWLLTSVTFGLYYPWARARSFSYLYSNTELEGSRFTFHGTGREMFLGFIKAIVLFVLIYGFFIWSSISDSMSLRLLGLAIFYIGFLVLIPLAVHGGLRYRLAKTSWRNIHFGYRGAKGMLVEIFIAGVILSSITFGIYSSWFTTELRKYIIGNIRFGNIRFRYNGNGSDLFWINFKGIFLSIFTLGIYLFWYLRNWVEYYINNIEVEQNDKSYPVKVDLPIGEYIGFQIVNFLLIIFTLGLAMAWVKVRTLNFFFQRVELPSEINLEEIEQTETDFSDATGEDIVDVMDLGII